MSKYVILLLSAAMLFSCANEKNDSNQHTESNTQEKMSISRFDIQGHRGARGYYPENTLLGFKMALKQGVTTLEMDAVITKDGEVILSHEPWLSHLICNDPDGNPISESKEKEYNIYQMNYDEIQEFDCGGRGNPRFPEQEKVSESKPRLEDVIEGIEVSLSKEGRPKVFYNIETKTSPKGDNLYHPEPGKFVEALVSVIQNAGILERTIIQSFDSRTLRYAHEKYPDIQLALLVGGGEDGIRKLDQLGFVPEIYSPNFEHLDGKMVEGLQSKGMRVIPWTVNKPSDIERLMAMGVDGIISDYPDRVVQAFEELERALSVK